MFITIDGKKQAFTAARVKRMYETLQLIDRGMRNGPVKDALIVEEAAADDESLPLVRLSSIVRKSLKP